MTYNKVFEQEPAAYGMTIEEVMTYATMRTRGFSERDSAMVVTKLNSRTAQLTDLRTLEKFVLNQWAERAERERYEKELWKAAEPPTQDEVDAAVESIQRTIRGEP